MSSKGSKKRSKRSKPPAKRSKRTKEESSDDDIRKEDSSDSKMAAMMEEEVLTESRLPFKHSLSMAYTGNMPTIELRDMRRIRCLGADSRRPECMYFFREIYARPQLKITDLFAESPRTRVVKMRYEEPACKPPVDDIYFVARIIIPDKHPNAYERFITEVEIGLWNNMHWPNAVCLSSYGRIIIVGTDKQQSKYGGYLVYEYTDGGTLEKYVSDVVEKDRRRKKGAEKALSRKERNERLEHLVNPIEHMLALHSAFIYHNDIKLANVYIKNQKAALGDYGESVKLEEKNLGYEATDCSWML